MLFAPVEYHKSTLPSQKATPSSSDDKLERYQIIRLLFFFLTVSTVLFLPRPAVAALTLADADAGYSITLLEGWERISPDIAREKSEAFRGLLPVPEDNSVRMQVQSAVFRQQGQQRELLILSAPNRAFGLDAEALNQLTKPGNAILEGLEGDLFIALERSGMTMRSSAALEDGLRLSYSRDALYGVMEFRFSTSHFIVAILSNAPSGTLPGALIIAPDKRLGQEKEHLRRYKESISSLLAVAGMVLMILVMRRRRRQVLGR